LVIKSIGDPEIPSRVGYCVCHFLSTIRNIARDNWLYFWIARIDFGTYYLTSSSNMLYIRG